MIQIRKELPDGDGSEDKWKIFDVYRSQYAEKAAILENMYPDEFITIRHDDIHHQGVFSITKKYMEKQQTEIQLNKVRGQKLVNNEHASILFCIPSFGDIFNCVYIPEEIQSAELIIHGNIISTWRKSCHPSEKITYDDVVYHKVNFLSPAMFSVQLTYGHRFIKLSMPCTYIMFENIFLSPEDHERIIKPEMIIFPEYDSQHTLYRATEGSIVPIERDCIKVNKIFC